LNEENGRALYVPERFSHGYLVLRDNTEISYQAGEFYAPGFEGGLFYKDPRLAFPWPLAVAAISDKDLHWKTLDEQKPEIRRMTWSGGLIVIIVDTALQTREKEGRSIRAALIGAGFMSPGLA
jgi:hypothetical protein